MCRSRISRLVCRNRALATTTAALALLLSATGRAAAQQEHSPCTDYAAFADTEGSGEYCVWNEAPAAAASQPVSRDVLATGGAEVLDAYIAARIELLEQRSVRFRRAMELARTSRIPVVIGTPAQVRERVAGRLTLGDRISRGFLAEFLVRRLTPTSAAIDIIAIRISLEELRRVPWWRTVSGATAVQRWIDETTDAILIHEIWGHLAPVLEAGDLTGRCADPAPGTRGDDACVMRRESELRRELGLEPRRDYAIRVL